MRRGSACLLLFLGLAWPKRNSQSLVAWHGFPERHWKAHGRVPALRSFYGDSVPVPPPGHPDYPVGAEVQPFANQNGGVDDTIAPPRLYMSHSCTWEVFAQPSLGLGLKETGMVQRQASGPEKQQLVDQVLAVLRKNGFAVLEGMVPADEQLAMEAAAIRHFEGLPKGYFTSPLRADRSQVHVPYEEPWSAEWLVPNDLVLRVTARYVINNMACGRSEEEQQAAWCQWVTQGSDMDWFYAVPPQQGPLATEPPHGCTCVGKAEELGPWLGRVMITKTPKQSPLMTRHRDIILPGPFAQLTIGVPLTPLVANNGPLALRPGSHVMDSPGYEVVTNIPHGSIMLYDSFVDHRAVEHHGMEDRYVLYYEFETRGIFTGYVDGHFGAEASKSEHDFREVVDPVLRRYVAELQEQRVTA
ncbi:unnamed protein product [Symbiodinium pilosum]|uniref:Aspartyl/asparaginy/proline hydroxylase domain-containing protein n=1 Tax=Symbiodinium pilosum TaxID=2952 RepID=A0A812W379_SYMPI|nr:unnamed protein product [Symbiodinium pilosum]